MQDGTARHLRAAHAGFDGTHIGAADVTCRQNPAILDQLVENN